MPGKGTAFAAAVWHVAHRVVLVPVPCLGLRGGTAHHPQHRQAAGAGEPGDQDGGEDQEGDVEPGGVVPGHALVGDHRAVRAGNQP